MLRILVIVEAAKLVSLVGHSPKGLAVLADSSAWGFLFETILLAVVLTLFVVSPWLQTCAYRLAALASVFLAAAVAVGMDLGLALLTGDAGGARPGRALLVAAVLALLVLAYFNWRQRRLSPALAEARLIALQSRIRPHFLFNSLNTAVSLVRRDARLAEQVLLDMAELFRALLADKRGLVPLSDEIRLAQSYLQIEQLRLGERLRASWNVGIAGDAANVPILILQPLIENAIRYGIEPSPTGGEVRIGISARSGQLLLETRNRLVPDVQPPSGNRIALSNIEERLALHFDAEASLRTLVRRGEFIVRVQMPLVAPPGQAKQG